MKVLIVGAGKLGQKLAESLVLEGIDVTVMDKDLEVIERINDHMDLLTIEANGIDIWTLKEIGIGDYDLLVATTSSDESNSLICYLAKKLGCLKTIARIRNPEYTSQLDFMKAELGIDYIVNPDLATARAMEKYLLKNYDYYLEAFSNGRVQMMEFNISNKVDFVGARLMDLDKFDNILVAAISRNGTILIPHGQTSLEKDDVLYLIGKTNKIKDFANKHKVGLRSGEIERVMILGGGNVGYYLAEGLSKKHIGTTIIEKDKKKCEDLSEKLENSLIVHGDGTDILLLEEEKLSSMDAFVGATGFDESNLLMGLMAKQAGVKKAVSKVSKENYSKIIDRLGVDVAINPIYITASNILKIIRGGKIVSISLFIGGDGEVTEIILDEGLAIINKSIEDLKLPKGLIIGSIVRSGQVIIPSGKTKLMAHDRIVVFCLTENLMDLGIFFKEKRGGFLSGLWNRSKDHI